MTDETAYRSAMAVALRALSLRDHSTAELTRKLTRRGYAAEVAEAVVAECLRLSYLDDARVAQQAIERLKRKGCGIHRIRRELARLGLGGLDSEKRLRESLDPREERSLALHVAGKKWKTLRLEPDPRKRLQRLQRFLHARGFSEAAILSVGDDIDAL